MRQAEIAEASELRSTRRARRILGIGACLVLLGVFVARVYFGDVTLTVSQQELQQRLEAAFPIKKTYLGVFDVTLNHPGLLLAPGTDRVTFSVDADADALGGAEHLSGAGAISGRIRFVPQSSELYLDDARVERLDLGGVPGQYAPALTAAAGIGARQYFNSHSLGTLPRPLLHGPLSSMRVKRVTVENGSLKITLGRGH